MGAGNGKWGSINWECDSINGGMRVRLWIMGIWLSGNGWWGVWGQEMGNGSQVMGVVEVWWGANSHPWNLASWISCLGRRLAGVPSLLSSIPGITLQHTTLDTQHTHEHTNIHIHRKNTQTQTHTNNLTTHHLRHTHTNTNTHK